MPPRYVKPYVKRNKNDAADAEAICEATSICVKLKLEWLPLDNATSGRSP